MLEPREGGKEEGAEARTGGHRKTRESVRDRNQQGQAAALAEPYPELAHVRSFTKGLRSPSQPCDGSNSFFS